MASPNLRDPSTELLDRVLGAVRAEGPASDLVAATLVAFDAPGIELPAPRRDAYEALQREVERRSADANASMLTSVYRNIRVCRQLSFAHLCGLLKVTLRDCVHTPYVMVIQHDVILLRGRPQVDWPGLLQTMDAYPVLIHYVGFMERSNLGSSRMGHCLNHTGVLKHGSQFCWFSHFRNFSSSNVTVPLTQALGFIDRIHVARTAWYLNFVIPMCGTFGETRYQGFPERAFTVSAKAELGREMNTLGISAPWPTAYDKYGTFLYGSALSTNGFYHYHLQGRCMGTTTNASDGDSSYTCDKYSHHR